jgi:tRNA 2-thiouridine synthesizing protein A
MTNDPSAVLVVDARGMRCPWPAIRLARAMRDAADVLLIADDPQAGREVAALAAEHGWRVEGDGAAEGRWRVCRR